MYILCTLHMYTYQGFQRHRQQPRPALGPRTLCYKCMLLSASLNIIRLWFNVCYMWSRMTTNRPCANFYLREEALRRLVKLWRGPVVPSVKDFILSKAVTVYVSNTICRTQILCLKMSRFSSESVKTGFGVLNIL